MSRAEPNFSGRWAGILSGRDHQQDLDVLEFRHKWNFPKDSR